MRAFLRFHGVQIRKVPLKIACVVLQEPEVSEMPPQRTRVRRGAVSASVMTEEQATSYVKKVYT